jgi:hypothetical protein
MDDLYSESIPDIDTLKEMCLSLLNEVAERGELIHQNVIISSGRFEACYDSMDETLTLKFVPEIKEILHDEGNESIFVS